MRPRVYEGLRLTSQIVRDSMHRVFENGDGQKVGGSH